MMVRLTKSLIAPFNGLSRGTGSRRALQPGRGIYGRIAPSEPARICTARCCLKPRAINQSVTVLDAGAISKTPRMIRG